MTVYGKYYHYAMKYGSRKKFANVLLNRMEARQKKGLLRSMPYKITIDPGNICNLQCPGCHTGIKHPEMITPRMLRTENFKAIFDQVKDHAFSVSLYNWGEPFLNKNLFDMVNYAHTANVGTTIHSNLNHFSGKMAEDCVKSGLTHVYLSIDGTTQENYEHYRAGGNIQNVLHNLELLIAAKKKYNSIYPLVTWKFIAFGHNNEEIEQARLLAEKYGTDSFEVYYGKPRPMDLFDEAAEHRSEPARLEHVPARCQSLWSSLYVNSDGTVFPCSLAFRPTEGFGNILQEPLTSLRNNNKFRHARGMFNGTSMNDEIPSPCNGCKYFVKCRELKNILN